MGGKLINLPGDVTTSTEDLIKAKLVFKSVLSTKKIFMCADISNLYIDNPVDR